MKSRASVLIGLLWCLALLSVVVIGALHTTRMDLIVAKNYGDRIQAHYLALAGVEKAEALLYRDAHARSRSDVNHDGELYNAPDDFRDVTLGRGQFDVFRRGSDDEGDGIVYGISDEESRLNVNHASAEELAKLDGMTADVVAAIVDWRDADNQVTPGGAEADYYTSLQPPYLPRNGPFQTMRELLMVRGVTSDLLFGNDTHDDGMLQAVEENGSETFLYPQADESDLGWANLLTVNSSIDNVNAAGDDRVNVQTADESSLTGVQGITPEIARAIVSYRGQHRLQSIADLLDVTAPVPNRNGARRSGGSARMNRNASGGTLRTSRAPGMAPPGSSSSGPKVISEDLLTDIADDVTTASGQTLPGVIDINTASLGVLICLPGVDRQLGQAIISFRSSNGFFPNIAWLLKVPGMTPNVFNQVAPLVSARSETFRILSEGKVNSTGVRQRIQIVVHVGLNDIKTLAYREDDL